MWTCVSRSRRSKRWCGVASQPSSTPRLSGSMPGSSMRTRSCQSASPFTPRTAQVGDRFVSYSDRRMVSSGGNGSPPGAPATLRAFHPRTRSNSGQGSESAGPVFLPDSSAVTASSSDLVWRSGLRLSDLRRLRASTRPTGWTWSSHSNSRSEEICSCMPITPTPAIDRRARPARVDAREPRRTAGRAPARLSAPARAVRGERSSGDGRPHVAGAHPPGPGGTDQDRSRGSSFRS